MIAYPSNGKTGRTSHRLSAEKSGRIVRRLSVIVYFGGLTVFLLYLVLFPDRSGTAVRNSLAVCGKRLIPSLLPFLVVSRLIGSTGLSDGLSDGIGGVFAKLSGLPETVTAAFLTGAVGGFPVGAAMIGSLYEQQKLSRDDAAFAAAVSDNAGLAFCVGGIGAAVFHQTAVGWQLYGCQIAAELLILAVCRKCRPVAIPSSVKDAEIPKRTPRFPNPSSTKSAEIPTTTPRFLNLSSAKSAEVPTTTPRFPNPSPTKSAKVPTTTPRFLNLSSTKLLSLTANAIAESGLTMLKICTFAIVFAVAGEPIVMGLSGISKTAAAVFASVWELTLAGETVAIVEREQTAKILAAFAVGFGGISVQAQIAAILSPMGISPKPCITLKFCQGILSAIFMAMIVRIC